MTIENDDFSSWAEYDSAAEWCAKRKRCLETVVDADLPANLSERVFQEIWDHEEAFCERVRSFSYALAMAKHNED